ncbi:uncharacterized protein METZ01_LOCUS212023 [marine metagenome]|uniref:Protein-L-isoaspartate(D-aspartate) O-methyltransferase n=1 Tax=marine metagenome TaxID=408172 RepID=A0A382F918_9ZZZZ
MDIELARFNMIEQQIRPWEVLDPSVLALFKQIPREQFVPPEYSSAAFADFCVPLAHGQCMMQPKVEARLLQALALTAQDRVLEVGTGTGYMTALLSSHCAHVTSIDIHGDFLRPAAARLETLGINNATLEEGDGADGWNATSDWDAILLTGSVPVLPDAYCQILAPGGRLTAIVGQQPIMEAMLYCQSIDGQWSEQSLFDTSLPPLINVKTPSAFTF